MTNLCLTTRVSKLQVDINDFFPYNSIRVQNERKILSIPGIYTIENCETLQNTMAKPRESSKASTCCTMEYALYAYFDKEAESNHAAKVQRLDAHFKSCKTKLVHLFLEFTLESLSKFNSEFTPTYLSCLL